MSRYYTTVRNHSDAIKSLLWDRLHSAISAHYTHDALHLMIQRDCWESNHFVRLPQPQKQYFRGLFEGWYRLLVWHQGLEWRVFKDGTWWTKQPCKTEIDGNPTRPFPQSICKLITPGFTYEGCIQDMGAHFWKPNGISTDFIYTVPKPYYEVNGWPTDQLAVRMPNRLLASDCLAVIESAKHGFRTRD